MMFFRLKEVGSIIGIELDLDNQWPLLLGMNIGVGGLKSEALWHGYGGYGGSPVNYGGISSPNLATNVI